MGLRTLAIIAIDLPDEVESFYTWLSRNRAHVLGISEEAERLTEAIASRYGVPQVALTRPHGSEPGDLLLSRGAFRYAPRYSADWHGRAYS